MIYFYQFNEVSPNAAGTVASSQAATNAASYLNLGVVGPLDDAESLDIVAELVGATGGSLGVFLQTSVDGQSFYDAISFPTLSAGAAAVTYRTCITRIAQPTSAAPVVIGKGLSPALAANTSVQGGFGSRARLVFVAGAGTTAGASIKVTVIGSRTGKTEY